MSDLKSGEPVQMYGRRYSKTRRPTPLIMCLFDIEINGIDQMTEDTSSQHEPERKQPGSFLASGLRIIHSSLYWLVGFIQLTEEEQIEAGIYLGHQRHG